MDVSVGVGGENGVRESRVPVGLLKWVWMWLWVRVGGAVKVFVWGMKSMAS